MSTVTHLRQTLLSLACAAAAAAFVTAHAAEPPPAPSAAQLMALCDGCAIVQSTRSEKRKGKASGLGAAGGAVAGGVIGHKAGDSTVATVGGAAVGGVIGHQIERQLSRHTVWITTATLKDGTKRDFETDQDPKWSPGETAKVDNGRLVRR